MKVRLIPNFEQARLTLRAGNIEFELRRFTSSFGSLNAFSICHKCVSFSIIWSLDNWVLVV